MPSAAVRRLYEDQIPSFMSVFDVENNAMDQEGTVTVIDPKAVMGMGPPKLPGNPQPELRPATLPQDASHKHHDSTSTQATESAESSPTTTVSCTDSSDLSDPSPSSSPDSPVVNIMPLSTFAPTPFGGLSGMSGLSMSENAPERPMTSPNPRRPKNMKGLSIQPPFGALSSSLMSEPCSPVFIKPTIPAMKRKPSQLSLKTGTSDLITRTTLEMPTSPSVPAIQVPPILQRRALKHSTSSPHMLSGLKSATFGPAGGMTIPTVLERNESGLSTFLRPPKPIMNGVGLDTTIAEEESPIRSQIANRTTFDIEPYHEVENNEDQKSPGYPDGPICIYPDNVFLYLEPTAEEASRFDLVINVAREVQNPFNAGKKQDEVKEQPADDSPIPDTALTAASFSTAFEFLPDESNAETPTTPKAQTFKEPEYVHMPWDHNTDIAPDLMSLCELIDKKAKDGKKVLVHCQQGASRSASLIIAYGMYQNPALSVNDAYYAAQARSRWISPNMKLMYSLQDFQKEIAKKKLPSAGVKPWSGKSPTKHRMTLSADNIDRPPKEPLTAPLPAEDTGKKDSPIERSPIRARGNSTPNRGEPISPGPSSAPSSFSWAEKENQNDPGRFGRFGPEVLLKPPQPDSGFASIISFSKPLPSPGLTPVFANPPTSPGPAILSFPDIPMSPGFAPPQPFLRPPPSPGFGAHRFGNTSSQGFGFVPLALSAPPKSRPKKAPSLQCLVPSQIRPRVEIERRENAPEPPVKMLRQFAADDSALMSPRAETMTNNPLRGPLPGGFAGMQFVESPPTPGEGLFSPRETMFPRDPFFPFGRPTQVADPRSPPTLGETPIVRSIDEVL